MIDDRNRLFVFGTLVSGLRDVNYHKTGSTHNDVLKGIRKKRRVDELRKVGVDTLLAVLVCFFLEQLSVNEQK